jgi:outer membrane protein assembly factor BamB
MKNRLWPLALFSLCSLLYAEESQSLLWRQALGAQVIGKPAAQAESVVLICDRGILKNYSKNGKLLWSFEAGGRLGPYLSRSREGTSYVSRTTGDLIAVNRSGRELWRLKLQQPLSGPVISGWDGRLFVPAGERLYCYTASGYSLWQKQWDAKPALETTADGMGGVIVTFKTRQGAEVHHINHFGETYVYSLSRLPAAPMAMRNETTGEVEMAMLYPDGSLELHGEKGAVSLPAAPGAVAAAVNRSRSIAALLSDGRVVFFGGQRWTWTGESHLKGEKKFSSVSMLYDERGIYVISPAGGTGFTEDGRRLWIISLKGAAACPVLSDDGILYLGGTDWILYAYKLEERVRRIRQSIYGPDPEGSYGLGTPPPRRDDEIFSEGEIRVALAEIRRDIRAGAVGAKEREYAAYLMKISEAALFSPARERPPVNGPVRAEALGLLAQIGSRETIPFLAGIFNADTDLSVKAAAAEAIGRIGVDPDGIAIAAFLRAANPAEFAYDERLLVTVAGSTGALCRFSGPPLANTGIKLLMSLYREDLPVSVRLRVAQELAALR